MAATATAKMVEEDPVKQAERAAYRRYQEYFGIPNE